MKAQPEHADVLNLVHELYKSTISELESALTKQRELDVAEAKRKEDEAQAKEEMARAEAECEERERQEKDRKSTRLNSSHERRSRMPSSA